MPTYWVYILASHPRGTLYIGVTNALVRRIEEHRAAIGSAFTRKYKVSTLVWYDLYPSLPGVIPIPADWHLRSPGSSRRARG